MKPRNCIDIMPKAQIARIWRMYAVSGYEIDHIAKREGVSRCHVHWAIGQGRRA